MFFFSKIVLNRMKMKLKSLDLLGVHFRIEIDNKIQFYLRSFFESAIYLNLIKANAQKENKHKYLAAAVASGSLYSSV